MLADESAGELEGLVQLKELERTPQERKQLYVALHLKLALVIAIAIAWAGFSLWLSLPWINTLGQSITMPLAIAVIFGIAIIPGYLNANLIASLLIDRPPPLRFDLDFPALTVVIACFNEEETIEETLDYVVKQEYPGELRILVADDGSKDRTAELARKRRADDARITVLTVPHGGKANTLTAALKHVRTPLMATVDADTLLMPDSLRRIVARLLISPPDTVAVAGRGLRAQFAQQLHHPRPGVGLLPRHRLGEAPAGPFPGDDGRPGGLQRLPGRRAQ